MTANPSTKSLNTQVEKLSAQPNETEHASCNWENQLCCDAYKHIGLHCYPKLCSKP